MRGDIIIITNGRFLSLCINRSRTSVFLVERMPFADALCRISVDRFEHRKSESMFRIFSNNGVKYER